MKLSLAFTAVAAAASLVGATASSALAAPVAAPLPTRVAERPVCGSVATGHARCLAVRLVAVPGSSPEGRQRATTAMTAHGPAGGFSPSDIAKAYGINPAAATSVKIAVVGAFNNPKLRADLNVFDRKNGLKTETQQSFAIYNQAGATTPLPAAQADWATEQSLDVQAVRGVCNLCRIIVVEADSDANADLAAAENPAVALGATVMTNSFGEPEPTTGVDPAVVAGFDHPGVALIAGSGDNGMDSWDLYNTGGQSANAPMYPASLPTVVAVGGTTLETTQAGARASESVWNDDGPADQYGMIFGQLGMELGATGGGCSTKFIAPAWQQATKTWSATRCGTHRLPADLAAVGDPLTGFDVYDSYGVGGGWVTIGGTSLSTPLVAGMWALAGGPSGTAYPAKDLYARPKSAFFDTTAGGNGLCGGLTGADCTSQAGAAPNTLGAGYLLGSVSRSAATASSSSDASDEAVLFNHPTVSTPSGGQVAPRDTHHLDDVGLSLAGGGDGPAPWTLVGRSSPAAGGLRVRSAPTTMLEPYGLLRDQIHGGSVGIRATRVDDTVVVVRTDADLCWEDAATMRRKLQPSACSPAPGSIYADRYDRL